MKPLPPDAERRAAPPGQETASVDVEGLVAEHLPALLAYVRLHADPVIRNRESCADIVQSVCREVLQDLDGFEYRGTAAFRSWLFTHAMSKLVNRKRYYLAKKRDVRREQHLTQSGGGAHRGVEALYATMYSPSQDAVAHETAARFERAFDQLSDDYKRVITLSRLIGMSHAEVAADMGRQEGAVRTLLHRALVRLGRLMAEQQRGGTAH